MRELCREKVPKRWRDARHAAAVARDGGVLSELLSNNERAQQGRTLLGEDGFIAYSRVRETSRFAECQD